MKIVHEWNCHLELFSLPQAIVKKNPISENFTQLISNPATLS